MYNGVLEAAIDKARLMTQAVNRPLVLKLWEVNSKILEAVAVAQGRLETGQLHFHCH